MGRYKDIDYNEVNNLFYYDETSPSFLRWKVSRERLPAGTIAGFIDSKGYYSVDYNNGRYKVHRIIYCLFHNGISSDLMIDHKDRIKINNKHDNIRECDYNVNNNNKTNNNPANRLAVINGETINLPPNVYKIDKNGRDYFRAQYTPANSNKRKTKSSFDLQKVIDWLENEKSIN